MLSLNCFTFYFVSPVLKEEDDDDNDDDDMMMSNYIPYLPLLLCDIVPSPLTSQIVRQASM